MDNTTAGSRLKQWRVQKPMKTEKRANIYHSDMDNVMKWSFLIGSFSSILIGG
jgi:hypothetical protein